MATVELDGNTIRVETGYHERELIKQVPGSKWDTKERTWRVPLTWAACVQLRGVYKDTLVIGPKLYVWALDELDRRINPSLHWREQMDGPGVPELWTFQRATVLFLKHAHSALLASEMGVGKSVIGATWLNEVRDLPALVVCPNGVKHHWMRMLKKWAPELRTQLIDGGASVRRKAIETPADVYVINWESLRTHSRLAPYGSVRLKRCEECGGGDSTCEVHPKELNMIDWGSVIADEAHRAKNPKALQTRALWAIGAKANRRIAMTGTPVANRPDDAWGIMHFVDPTEWPSRSKYIDRYALQSWNSFGGLEIVGVKPETSEEFFKILDPRMRRDLKEIVMPWLPPKTYAQRDVDMGTKQRKAYNDLEKSMIADVGTGVLTAPNALERALRMWQLCSSMLDDEGKPIEPSSKLDELESFIEEAGGLPIVVFAESRRLIELAEARLSRARVPFVSVHGGIHVNMRDINVQKFQNGDVKVLLATYATGGEGITLTAAHFLVRLQRTWNAVLDKQAEDRVHRGGLEHKVEIVDFTATDSIEANRIEGLQDKSRMLEEIVRDKRALKKWMKGEGDPQ